MSLKQLTVPSGQGDISRVIIVNWEFDKDFADATLASEDGELLEAHRVILSTICPAFEKGG